MLYSSYSQKLTSLLLGLFQINSGVESIMATVLVLYTIVNSESDKDDPLFNAFHMPRGSGTTLKTVKE